jgi:hypothetical protein
MSPQRTQEDIIFPRDPTREAPLRTRARKATLPHRVPMSSRTTSWHLMAHRCLLAGRGKWAGKSAARWKFRHGAFRPFRRVESRPCPAKGCGRGFFCFIKTGFPPRCGPARAGRPQPSASFTRHGETLLQPGRSKSHGRSPAFGPPRTIGGISSHLRALSPSCSDSGGNPALPWPDGVLAACRRGTGARVILRIFL